MTKTELVEALKVLEAEGIPVTFRVIARGIFAQGWVGDVTDQDFGIFESGPFGGDSRVPLESIDPESLAYMDREKRTNWIEWRAKPLQRKRGRS
jgi:hypothetical protein